MVKTSSTEIEKSAVDDPAVEDAVEQAAELVMAVKPESINDGAFLQAVLVRIASMKRAELPEQKIAPKSEAFVRALERGKIARSVMEQEEGGSRSSEQIAELLGISRQAVDQRRRSRRLVAWQDSADHWRFPIWQFDPATARPYPGLNSILAALPDDPWSDMIFFLSKDETLGARPLDFLRSGRAKRAVLAALRYSGQDG
jgi:hypothetical protein